MNAVEYRARRERIGALDCVLVAPSAKIEIAKVAFFCHGFGASGEDLVGIAEELLNQSQSPAPIEMVFPAAPLDLEQIGMPGGRAWWLLSIARLIAAYEEGNFDQVREEVPEGIDTAREMLVDAIDLVLERHGLDCSKLLLGGFSQGAMLSVDTALRGLNHPPAALCLYSGALICERQWSKLVTRLKDCRIVQSHGRQDTILPFQAGSWLRDMLSNAGCAVDFIAFNGPHTIPWEAIEKTAKALDSI